MYRFPPTPVLDDPLYKLGQLAPGDPLLEAAITIGDESMAKDGHEGHVGFETSEVRPECRVANVAWLYQTPKTQAVYDLVSRLILDANSRWFQFDLAGFHDALQYTTYEGEKSGHFNWHMDMGDKYGGPQRKLSLSLILSDPSEYEGGDFQVMDGGTPKTIELKGKGTIIVFPSYLIHRVTPVTKGTRKALVAWACGPKFR